MKPMATATGKRHQGGIRSPVRGGIGAFVVAKQMGPDAAPGGAVLENSFMPSFSHGLEGVKKFKLSGDEAPVRCHSERSEESRSVFLPLRTELRARFLASLGMTAPVDFFTGSCAVG